MPFVRRDGNGKIVGVFANKQPGRAEEFLADNSLELASHRAPRVLSPGDLVEDGIKGDPGLDALVRRIATKESITERELIDELRLLERKAVKSA
jgi:hypothetical protein